MRTQRWQQVSPAFAVYMRLRSGDMRGLTADQRMLAGLPLGMTITDAGRGALAG
jgi:hypothetical protein